MADTRQGRVIQVAKLPTSDKIKALPLLAQLCKYYPQYTLAEARKLPYVHVMLLLKTARKMEAAHYLNLTQIAAAPQSKKGIAVKQLITHFKKAMKNG